ncbi:hypothetical protein VZT92_008056 [Zoarces viviparus]|uniref:Uncharacterized protein n=1 Tax=Zoarces viviparus TaxID=48416 RepID=A0AAW1FLN6_ZOAVI
MTTSLKPSGEPEESLCTRLVSPNVNSEEAERAIAKTTMVLYVIRKEGADEEDEPEDVGVVIEVLMNLDGRKLSPKVQALKMKKLQ